MYENLFFFRQKQLSELIKEICLFMDLVWAIADEMYYP